MSSPQFPNVLGIDFGTSNSAVGVARNNQPHLIAIEQGQTTLPTSIFFDSEDKVTRFGRAANQSLITGEEGRFMRALKRVLGTSLMHEKRYLLGENLTFIDIIARFLNEIKSRAENETQQGFDYALSGRPVHFHSGNDEKDKQALIDLTQCYLQAGFKGVEFLAEPEAAAIANGGIARGEIALIVDIGGGTSDFCLFKRQENSIEVLASHGIRIGGTNFDKSLSIDHVMPLLGYGEQIKKEMGAGTLRAPNTIFLDLATWEKIPSLYSPESKRFADKLHKLALDQKSFSLLKMVLEEERGHDIAFAVERGKIDANKQGISDIELSIIEKDLAIPITTERLISSLQGHAEKISSCALETLLLAQCSPANVDQIIFVGGSSLMNVVETSITPHFPNAHLHYADAFTAIVDGLAIASEQYS